MWGEKRGWLHWWFFVLVLLLCIDLVFSQSNRNNFTAHTTDSFWYSKYKFISIVLQNTSSVIHKQLFWQYFVDKFGSTNTHNKKKTQRRNRHNTLGIHMTDNYFESQFPVSIFYHMDTVCIYKLLVGFSHILFIAYTNKSGKKKKRDGEERHT